MAKVTRLTELPYYPLFMVVAIGIAVGWNFVVKAACDRLLLPMLCAGAKPGREPLRVTNNDGTLSSGEKLQGWPNAIYFGLHGALWMVGCVAITMATVRAWPQNHVLGQKGPTRIIKKPPPADDLA